MNKVSLCVTITTCLLFCALSQAPAAPPQRAAKGKLSSGVFDSSEIFPGTRREYSVYLPAEYDASKPANLMVFMDGKNYAKPDGAFRVPEVFDSLIAAGQMPVTVAVFVNPGTITARISGAASRSNRSYEYDTLGENYSHFLIEEFLPTALEGINVSTKPQDRAVCGISSGGICAFSVAWERPEQFGKVLSQIGSYTNIRGGWAYPGLVRQTKDKPRPIKVYLQEGIDDLSNLHGNWPLANRDMAAALQYAGYHYKFEMTDGGHGGRWAGEVFPDALTWLWDENSEPTKIPPSQTTPEWTPHPDAIEKSGVPQGTVKQMPDFESSEIFPGTTRKWSVYVPAKYDASSPAALMVVQDGQRLAETTGKWRFPTILDNLIAAGDMPPTIAVFIDPGHNMSKKRNGKKSSNRSYEYDSLGNRYVSFLLDEILPIVQQEYNISDDPKMRAIGGSSSGAICAFTAAWERPDQFSKVYSSVGSFTNIRGGDAYSSLVRKTQAKPIRVYMADTSGDIDNAFGSWPIANQRMASSLTYMGYDTRFDWAEGYGHNPDFGSSKLPDALRWLWRSETHRPVVDTSDDLRGDLTLLNLLVPGQDWETVATDLGFTDGCCADEAGNFYFCDMRAPAIYRIDVTTGKQTIVANESVSGLEFGPDGRLFACQGKQKRVVAIDVKTGAVQVIAKDVRPNDLAVTQSGHILITETPKKQVTMIEPKSGVTTAVDVGINRPNGIGLSPDGATLAISDHGGSHTWLFRVLPDGTLDAKMPNMPMRLPIDYSGEFQFNQPPPYSPVAKGDGLATDKQGRYYVTSALGVQIFDPTGRPCGLLPTPDPTQPIVSCILAGEGHSYLYVANGKTVYRRKLNL